MVRIRSQSNRVKNPYFVHKLWENGGYPPFDKYDQITSTTGTINIKNVKLDNQDKKYYKYRTMEQFRFRNWQVYQDSQKLFSEILGVVNSLPHQFRNSFGDQITRSSLSIVLNIAEGSGKNSIKELNRFLNVALGSAYETLACADTLMQNKFITPQKQRDLEKRLESICSQIGGFKKKLRHNQPEQ